MATAGPTKNCDFCGTAEEDLRITQIGVQQPIGWCLNDLIACYRGIAKMYIGLKRIVLFLSFVAALACGADLSTVAVAETRERIVADESVPVDDEFTSVVDTQSTCTPPSDAEINAAMSLFGELPLPDPQACSAEALACPATDPLTEEGKKMLMALEKAFSNAQTFSGDGHAFITWQDGEQGQAGDEFNYYDIPYKDGKPDIDVIWEILHKAYGLPYVKGKVHPSLAYYVFCNNYAWGGWFNNNCKHMSAIVVAGMQSRGIYCGQNSVPAHVCAIFYSKPPPGATCSGWWVLDWYGQIRPAGLKDKLTLLNGQLVAHPVWGISPRAPQLTICPGYGLVDDPKDPKQQVKPGGTIQPKVPPAPGKKPRR